MEYTVDQEKYKADEKAASDKFGYKSAMVFLSLRKL